MDFIPAGFSGKNGTYRGTSTGAHKEFIVRAVKSPSWGPGLGRWDYFAEVTRNSDKKTVRVSMPTFDKAVRESYSTEYRYIIRANFNSWLTDSRVTKISAPTAKAVKKAKPADSGFKKAAKVATASVATSNNKLPSLTSVVTSSYDVKSSNPTASIKLNVNLNGTYDAEDLSKLLSNLVDYISSLSDDLRYDLDFVWAT